MCAVLLLLSFVSGRAGAIDDLENRRIEYLIAAVEHLDGAQFVRNGSGHDGKQAAAHLRLKRKYAGSRVRSAEDFITLCASKSYLSGKPYLMCSPKGKRCHPSTFSGRSSRSLTCE